MSRTSIRTTPRAAAALLAAALFAAPSAAAAQALPDGRAVVDRYIEAVGGRAALEKAATSRAVGTFEMPGAGLTGSLEVISAPNRMLTRMEIPGLGDIRSGYDGQVAWSVNPMQGPRVLEGAEKAMITESVAEGASWRAPSLVSNLTTVGRDTIAGTACMKVKVTWKSGRESFDCYAEDTGLLHATVATQESPMGSIEATTILSDYKTVNGVKVPHTMQQQAAGQQMTMKVNEMTLGQVPSDAFALPAEIQALVKKP